MRGQFKVKQTPYGIKVTDKDRGIQDMFIARTTIQNLALAYKRDSEKVLMSLIDIHLRN